MAERAHKPPTPVAAPSSPSRKPLTVRVEPLAAGVILIQAHGSIDCVTAPDLQRQVQDAMRSGHPNPPRLLLDLSGVTFLDQVGLEALLHLQERWGAAPGGGVDLLVTSPSVVRLLHEADLDGESWMRSAPEEPGERKDQRERRERRERRDHRQR